MARSVLSLLRVLIFAVGVGALIMVWRFAIPEIPGLFMTGLGPLTLLLELSLRLALILLPFALMALSLRPQLWKFCAMPLVWSLVVTVLLRPAVLLHAT